MSGGSRKAVVTGSAASQSATERLQSKPLQPVAKRARLPVQKAREPAVTSRPALVQPALAAFSDSSRSRVADTLAR